MTRKLAFLVTAVVLLASALPATAQQTGKVYRIGFLTSGSPGHSFKPRLAAFRRGLRELGYVEGQNIVIEERYGRGRLERMSELATELIRLEVDLIVTHGGRWAQLADRAAKKAGKTIPMVFAVDADPVGRGFIASLARPGGNITGLSDAHGDLVPKRLELLKRVDPSASRVAVLWDPRIGGSQMKALRAVAPGLGITLLPIVFPGSNVDRAFDAIRRERPDALNVFGYSLMNPYRRRIAEFAVKNRLPTIGTGVVNAEAGMLMSYGTIIADLYHRAASYVDKILKGAKPAELPVEQPTKFYLTLNFKTAKALGFTFPPSILLRADRVIE